MPQCNCPHHISSECITDNRTKKKNTKKIIHLMKHYSANGPNTEKCGTQYEQCH